MFDEQCIPHHESLSVMSPLPTPHSSDRSLSAEESSTKRKRPRTAEERIFRQRSAWTESWILRSDGGAEERIFRQRSAWTESWILRSDGGERSSTSMRAAILAAGALVTPARIIGLYHIKRRFHPMQTCLCNDLLALRTIRPPYPCRLQPRIQLPHAFLLRALCSCAAVTSLRLSQARSYMFPGGRNLQERLTAAIVDRIWQGYSSKIRVSNCKKRLFSDRLFLV